MAGLIRQGHFLGAKLRSLRKRNGLTLDELSARCVQIDAAECAVGVLSEHGGDRQTHALRRHARRCSPASSARTRAGFSTRTRRSRPRRETARRGGLAAMPLEPAFLFSHELLQNALPELLSQTGTTGRQFAQLLIRVWQETRHNNFPDIERAAEQCGKRQMPLDARGRDRHLQASRARDPLVRRRRPQTGRRPGALAIRGARNRVHQQAPAQSGRAAQVRAGVLRRPQDPAQRRRRHLAAQRRATRRCASVMASAAGHGRAGCAVRVARLRMQLLRRRAAVSENPVPTIPDPRSAQCVAPAASSA